MLELLAPGGSAEGMKAAVNAGADAVYMGGRLFGARAYAQNPDEEGLLEALDYCHIRGKRLYLTVNTLLKEDELEKELYPFLLPLYEHGLDAVLVQDLGVLSFIREAFPELAIHASTQMSVASVHGALQMKKLGLQRIVPARELSLEEIKRMVRESGLEIECFVHGALCYSYSGQCLMSSMIGGRSGNRGRCAQPCRQPSCLLSGGKNISRERETYLLSLKDICTLRILPDLIEAGICSFKMEGRMKRPEYAAVISRIYRKYLDLYRRNGRKGYTVDPEDEKELCDLYNRGGFSEGYYHMYNNRSMMSMARPNHAGTPGAKVLSVRGKQLRLKALEDLGRRDALEVGEGAGNNGKELLVEAPVKEGAQFTLSCPPGLAKEGQTLARVRNETLLEDARRRFMEKESQIKIKGNFTIKSGQPVILSVSADCICPSGTEPFSGEELEEVTVTVTGDEPAAAQARALQEAYVRKQLGKTGNTPFIFDELAVELEDQLFYPLQGLNELRRKALEELERKILRRYCRRVDDLSGMPDAARELYREEKPGSETDGSARQFPGLTASVQTEEQLQAVLEIPEISVIYTDVLLFMRGKSADTACLPRMDRTAQQVHGAGKKFFLMFPPIWRSHIRDAFVEACPGRKIENALALADGVLLGTVDQLPDLGKAANVAADACIYTWNGRSRLMLKRMGFSSDTVPFELNRKEIIRRGSAGSEMIIYGYIPLMNTAQCLRKNTSGCSSVPGLMELCDRRGAHFPVRNRCQICTNVIYNSVPLDLLSNAEEIRELQVSSCRLSFTVENGRDTKEIALRAARLFGREEEGIPSAEAADAGCAGTRGHFKRGVE